MQLFLGIFVTGSIIGGLNIPVFLSFGLLALSLVTSYYIASKGNRIARYFSWIYWLPIEYSYAWLCFSGI